jgi:hypothetical protein
MKHLVLILIFCLGLFSICEAAPFLICDVYPSTVIQPTFFKVSLDGGSEVDSSAYATTGGVMLHHNVGSVSVGVHSWTVRACIETDPWGGGGCSATSPFSSTRHEVGSGPTAPTGTRLSAQ